MSIVEGATRTYNVADIFELVAETIPDSLAAVAIDERRTYAELDEQASRFGRHLVDVGVEPGDHVAIVSWNRIEWLEAMLGCFKARAVPINVNYRYVDAEIAYLLENSDAVAVVAEPAFVHRIEGLRADLPLLKAGIALEANSFSDAADSDEGQRLPEGWVAWSDALAAADPAVPFEQRSNDDLYLLYTGGTTGMPKGVMWRLEDIFFAAFGGGRPGGEPITTPEQICEVVSETPADERWAPNVVTSPMMHGNGQWNTFMPLLSGRGVVYWCEHRFDAGRIAALAEAEQARLLVLVGDGMARPFADHLAASPGAHDLSGLAMILSGGAILSASLKAELAQHLPDVLIVDGFGASETGGNGALVDPGTETGRPRFNMGPHTTVLDEDLEPMEAGTGEPGMLARSGHIPLGYYKDEAKTAKTFPTSPSGTRWAVPGDQAILEADGTITLLGRGSNCINTGGEKVFPEEVEIALKSLPDVAEAFVVGVPHERFGSAVTAVVEPKPGATPDLETIRAGLRDTLAGYKLPRGLVVVDKLSYTGAGKPDYKWAKAQAAEASASIDG
ncbi:MAG: acyl-CoA synthetase [Acidimicrobiales bacterium]